MALACPGCGVRMISLREASVEVERCPACDGLWLDRGELTSRGGALPAENAQWMGQRPCPRCSVPMQVVAGGGIEIDRCSSCMGIYLDRGELELLQRIHRPRPPPRRARPPQPAPAASRPPEPTFDCDLCHQEVPLGRQVVGVVLTVCRECAAKHQVEADLAGRRAAELERGGARSATEPQSGTEAGTRSTVGEVASGLHGLADVLGLLAFFF